MKLVLAARESGVQIPAPYARTLIEEDVAMWVPAGERHQILNTSADTLKLATVFVPAYKAGENYKRCLDAAKA